MAVDAYMVFYPYSGGAVGTALKSESMVDFSKSTGEKLGAPFVAGSVFEVEDFNFDIEQTLNLSSQSRGTGAGKVKFNGITVNRKIDRQSPQFFQMACAGTPFALVSLGFRKAGGGTTAGLFFLRFDFRVVAVETISWSHDEESPKEEIKMQFGAMQVYYYVQNNDGTLTESNASAWSQLTNTSQAVDPGVLKALSPTTGQ